ncbi:MAG: lipid-A-disaccharide synthase [Gammaproteobacteria bacterium]|nr:lipid-A-disaccharide synthase [Gammaproteobacteria bacterium]
MKIGIIVGEASGDLLGASLVHALKKIHPNVTVTGIIGPRLKECGAHPLYNADRLAVMGFVEPLKRLPELLRIRRQVIRYFSDHPPDVFIGIDAPDFTLPIEKTLKKRGITTVHYVSPSVWAWRQGRIKTIQKAVDLMMVLFPFEENFYREHKVPVVYVGHPMARKINQMASVMPTETQNIAILPGSRHSEITHMAPVFLKTAVKLQQTMPHLQFLSPMASPTIREHFLTIKAKIAPKLNITLYDGQADDVLRASSAALITSGTATLQAMLHGCPMVVGFKTSTINAWLIRRLYHHPFFSLPNILFQQKIVAEYFQEDATIDNLFSSLMSLLEAPEKLTMLRETFSTMREKLCEPSDNLAAQTISCLITQKNTGARHVHKP